MLNCVTFAIRVRIPCTLSMEAGTYTDILRVFRVPPPRVVPPASIPQSNVLFRVRVCADRDVRIIDYIIFALSLTRLSSSRVVPAFCAILAARF
jgi:hypothetical protein